MCCNGLLQRKSGGTIDDHHVVVAQQVVVVLVQLDGAQKALVLLQRLLGDQGLQRDGREEGEEPMPETRPTAGMRFCMGFSMQMYIFSASLIWLVITMWVMVS